MRKIIYIAITFAICYILKIQKLWIGFTPVFLSLFLFKTEDSFLWEIPLGILVCDVFVTAFSEDMRILIYSFVILSTLVVTVVSPKKLALVFFIAISSVVFENIYSVAALWATIWYGTDHTLRYFTTKRLNLQEHKS